jgi:hypothetical protein
MWGNAGTRETTVVTSDAPGGIASRRAVYMSIRQLSTMLRPSVSKLISTIYCIYVYTVMQMHF